MPPPNSGSDHALRRPSRFHLPAERRGELKRITVPVDTHLEMTEIADRVLRAGGPALMFEQPVTGGVVQPIPVLANLFGTPQRVAMGMGEDVEDGDWSTPLREVGKLLAYPRSPSRPRAWGRLGEAAGAQAGDEHVATGGALGALPGSGVGGRRGRSGTLADPALLARRCRATDHLGPGGHPRAREKRQNLGIYRQQVLGRNKVIMRWLAHRGGALDFRDHQQRNPGEAFPVAVVLGCDPATILGAVTPVPDSISEYQFAGLLRGAKTELVRCKGCDLQVPASSEIVLEGVIHPGEEALEGPTAITPATTTNRPPSRCSPSNASPCAGIRSTTAPTPASRPTSPRCWGGAQRGIRAPCCRSSFRRSPILPATRRLFVQAGGGQHPQAVPRPRQAGDVRHLELPAPVHVPKFIIVVDEDVNIREWKEVIWAMTTRVDATRDTTLVDNTPSTTSTSPARSPVSARRWASTPPTSGR